MGLLRHPSDGPSPGLLNYLRHPTRGWPCLQADRRRRAPPGYPPHKRFWEQLLNSVCGSAFLILARKPGVTDFVLGL